MYIYIDRAKVALPSDNFVHERKHLKISINRTLHIKTTNFTL